MCLLLMAVTQLNVVKNLPYLVSNAMALLTCFPIAIGIMVFGKLFGGLFENKMLAMTGMISYEIYLIHAFTLDFVQNNYISIFGFIAGTLSIVWLLNRLLSLILKRKI